ncbi:MAG: hypothetical protein ACJA2S_000884 [Cyclobacteriaceae bacterium]|jgi:hypothetical protein
MRRILTAPFTAILIIMNFSSCKDLFQNELSNNGCISQFLKLDSLLKSNVVKLKGRKMIKEVLLDGKKETMNFIADSALLAGDFELFADIDISKPTFFGEYDIDQSDRTETYNRKGKKGPQWVVLKRGSSSTRMQIEAEYIETNLLYDSRRDYKLIIDQRTNEILEYQFSGYQKLVFKDTVFFSVTGEFL